MTGAVGRGVRRCGAVLALVLGGAAAGCSPTAEPSSPDSSRAPAGSTTETPLPTTAVPAPREPRPAPVRDRGRGRRALRGGAGAAPAPPGLRVDAGHHRAGSRRPGDRQPRDVRRLGRAPRAGQAVHLLRRHARPSRRWPRPGSTWRAWPTTTPSTSVGHGSRRPCGPRPRPGLRWPSSGSEPTRTTPSPRPSPTWTAPAWRPSPPRPPTRTPRPTPRVRGRQVRTRPVSRTRSTRGACSGRYDGRTPRRTWSSPTCTGAIQGERCPSADQRALARRLVGAGADVVVGSHAHELQGDGRLGPGYVAYGLGNFAWYSARSHRRRSR